MTVVKLHVEIRGEGPDLVLLHGWSLGGMLALQPAALADALGFLARHPDGEAA